MAAPGIVDSQVHIWGTSTPERPWPARAHAHREEALGADEVLQWMNAGGIDRAIIVPPSWEGDRNDLAIAAVLRQPGRFAIMGRFDPEAPRAREQLPRWREQPGMLGVRFTFHTEILRRPFLEGRYDWVWSELERHGHPVMVLLHHAYMDKLDAIAGRYPGLRIVVDHLGLVNGEKDAHAFRGLDQLLALSARSNVAVKVSALPCYTDEPYPYVGLHAQVRRVYDTFGPRRMFWGTDQSRSPVSYAQGVEMFTKHIPWLGEQDREWIMGRGVCEWLGWKT